MKVKEHFTKEVFQETQYIIGEDAYIELMQMEINRLNADNEKLRAALKPFADEAQFISPHTEDTWFYYDGIRFGDLRVGIDDLRAAAAALKETGNE